jgi:hypothetical protein
VKKPQLSDAADSIGFRPMGILCLLRYLRSEYRATCFAGPFGERQFSGPSKAFSASMRIEMHDD